ncbi:inovirus Gp2 family protein [Vibrio methylphosphonaticus]|uniref:inovirus Gp2 family protein n=1 Tax=Vibrio methylphosphonaticus TaxID=2946866 RepID=UPI00202A726E|nr:inovirus Gp2 family protein [Vibrio methylphosphonaticus]MCL9773573.1 inovirus Gp2 family protein [Vibrio methylphosphonaticus]
MLYRGSYRLNSKYKYDQHRLQSLLDFYNYLQLHHHRYQFLNVTLSYTDGSQHNPDNITNLLRHLRRAVKVNGEKVPLHHIWKLEYRPSAKHKDQAVGYHYHLVVIWNRDVLYSSAKVEAALTKQWEKLGGVVNKNAFYGSHDTLKEGKGKNGTYPLTKPTKRTETASEVGIFHHLSYLAKTDPLQALPEDYIGEEFQTSQRLVKRLTDHPAIKVHNLTLVAPPLEKRTVTTPDNNPEPFVFDESEPPF